MGVFPLCLGGNVFGWTADERQSFEVLDAYAEAGGNFLDTADMYSSWVPGNTGGESETIIGRWMKARRNREGMIIATKVGMAPGSKGLAPGVIRTAAEASLRRLGVERIDLYYAHQDDTDTPIEDSLRAFDALVREGKVARIAASNYTAPRLAEALAISNREGLARFVALQPNYNLANRGEYEGGLRDLCAREHLVCYPYYSLAKGFLTGKYRPGVQVDSTHAAKAGAFLTDRGLTLLAALDDIAAAHRTTVAAVALAWLRTQPTVGAVIASARTAAQLADLLPMATLQLRAGELTRLAGI